MLAVYQRRFNRLFLREIEDCIVASQDFAFETTLSTRSYVSLIKEAKQKEYKINLLYFWLSSPEFAIDRVAKRGARYS